MRTLSLISDTSKPCGVEQFQRRLAARMNASQPDQHRTCAVVGQPGEIAVLDRALETSDAIVIGLPVVAWKRRLAAPLRAMALARRRGKAVILVLHEWGDLDWKRRALYRLYVPFATRLMFSSPVVRAQFASDRIASVSTSVRDLLPIPPNLQPPARATTGMHDTALAASLHARTSAGALVLGTFGSIYPRKQPGALLDIVATLKAGGHNVHAVFVGDFVRDATVDVQAVFKSEVTRLGLADDVTVTGYIADTQPVFAALGACDVLAYRFDEGLTSRRASVFAALLSGRPVVVNAPPDAHEFDHHESYRMALRSGALTLVPTQATTADFGRAILAVRNSGTSNPQALFDHAWTAAATAMIKTTNDVDPLPSAPPDAALLS